MSQAVPARAGRWWWAGVLVVLAGCSGNDDAALVAAEIVDAGPSEQQSVVGETAPQPLTGRAMTADGTPARSARLLVTLFDSRRLPTSQATIRADNEGLFEVRPLVGTLAGPQTVEVASPDDVDHPLATYRIDSYAGPVARVFLTPSDDQTTTQHRRFGTHVVARQTDRYDNPTRESGLTITAAAGSGYVGPTSLSPIFPDRPWRASFAQVGDHSLRVSHANGASATLVVHVTPTTHPFDGFYRCELRLPNGTVEARPEFHIEGASLLNIELEPFGGNPWPLYPSSFDETTGESFLIVRRSLDFRFQMRGTFVPDGTGGVAGSGIYHTTFATPPPSGPPTGTWSCVRA